MKCPDCGAECEYESFDHEYGVSEAWYCPNDCATKFFEEEAA